MKILYFEEHKSCKYYIINHNTGFCFLSIKKGDSFKINNSNCNSVIFLLKGNLTLEIDSQVYQLKDSTMFLLSISKAHVCRASSNLEFIHLYFERCITVCDKFFISSFSQKNYEFHPLKILPELDEYLLIIRKYIDSGMFCRHMHDLKQAEYLFLLRLLYNKQDLSKFLSPISSSNVSFRNSVLKSYHKIKYVEELATMLNMNFKTFCRRFKDEFNDSPYKWLCYQKGQQILLDIKENYLSFSEIAYKYNFSSSSHFTKYCKKHLGGTPSTLRMKSNSHSNEASISHSNEASISHSNEASISRSN